MGYVTYFYDGNSGENMGSAVSHDMKFLTYVILCMLEGGYAVELTDENGDHFLYNGLFTVDTDGFCMLVNQ